MLPLMYFNLYLVITIHVVKIEFGDYHTCTRLLCIRFLDFGIAIYSYM